jgi:hypothetical protein
MRSTTDELPDRRAGSGSRRQLALIASAAVVFVGWASGCSGCSTPPVKLPPTLGRTADHQIRCDCTGEINPVARATFFNDVFSVDGGPGIQPFSVDLCAPAEMNTSLGATLTEEEYGSKVKSFCRFSGALTPCFSEALTPGVCPARRRESHRKRASDPVVAAPLPLS